jgi:hypothetical protein
MQKHHYVLLAHLNETTIVCGMPVPQQNIIKKEEKTTQAE